MKISKLPLEVKGCLSRAIDERGRCNRWHLKHPEAADDRDVDSEGHAYFLWVLKEAQRILEKTKPEAAQVEATEAANMFANLKIEEIFEEEAARSSTIGVLTEQAQVSRSEAQAEDLEQKSSSKNAEADVALIIFCLLNDLARLRTFLRDIWESKKAGRIGSITASIITNTAIAFVKALETDSLNARTSAHTCEAAVEVLGDSLKDSETAQPGREVNDLGLAELTSILANMHQLDHPKFKAYIAQTIKDERDLGSPFDHTSFEVLEVLPLLQELIVRGKPRSRDLLLDGLAITLETRKVDLWVVFASRIFLDIYVVMGSDIDSGLTDLQDTAKNVQRCTEQYFGYSSLMDPPMSDEYNNSLSDLQKTAAYYTEDRDNDEAEHLLALSNHPWGLGLEDSMLTLGLYDAGRTIANYLNVVRASLHLYNGLLQTEKIKEPWPVMEESIEYFTPEKVFIGPRPKDISACVRRCEVAAGISVQLFAKGARYALSKQSQTPRRPLLEPPPIIEMLCRRYLAYMESWKAATPRMFLDSAPVDQKSMAVHVVSKELLVDHAVIKDIMATYPTGKNNKSRKGKLRKQWDANNRMGLVQVLTVLRDAIGEVEPTLRFDFFAAHKRAWNILRTVDAEFQEDFRRNNPDLGEGTDKGDRALQTAPLVALTFSKTYIPNSRRWGAEIMVKAAEAVTEERAREAAISGGSASV